jgi:mRNA-degrading endonuclease RelE of RelBE toxin-antitoxin system
MDTNWSVEFTASARREFKLLGARERSAAVRAIFDLAENPFLAGSIALRGYSNLYRIRFWHGRFRMIYYVSEKQHKVVVTRLRPRGTAYIGMRGEV